MFPPVVLDFMLGCNQHETTLQKAMQECGRQQVICSRQPA